MAGDFTVSVLFRPPADLEPFHMLLSRRADSDDTQNHQIFIDTRSTWENSSAGSAANLMKIRLPLIAMGGPSG